MRVPGYATDTKGKTDAETAFGRGGFVSGEIIRRLEERRCTLDAGIVWRKADAEKKNGPHLPRGQAGLL